MSLPSLLSLASPPPSHLSRLLQSMGSSCIGLSGCGEGNGTPLQYSCLENPMDRGAL